MKVYLINCTTRNEFSLSVLSLPDSLQPVLFSWVLSLFLLTVLGNVTITVLVYTTPGLHTPMYYFLCNLAVEDVLYVCTTLPKFLAMTISLDTRIMLPGCLAQMFVFLSCAVAEFLLLGSMAYDRYVAICVPLRYTSIMNRNMCIGLSCVPWIVGLFNALMNVVLVLTLSFCHSHNINQFFCDLKTIISLSTDDTTRVQTLVLLQSVFLGLVPFVTILISYTCIISSIIRIHSSARRLKAFSSCSSHLTIVILFCGVSISSYMIPQSLHSQEQDKVLSLIYTALVPMFNPLVYSFRNKQVLGAIDTVVKRYSTRCRQK
ncbi:hypothetical protein GDO81_020851 [Engystomops pustulosus]|uniref:Olfactory receptor n=1 Tax=Engystomops pustulosus TaxID=76066 RepID=A0AAV6ZQU9_ENGPU|nr:hypothetical protein GDO81_020851 [Engystomops pustulosus]